MTWTNAFDVGPCSLTVTSINVVGTLWTGTLGKGASSSPFAGYLANEMLQVVVSTAGIAALNWVSGNGPSTGYQLSVTPSYDISSSAGIRVSGITMPNGVSGDAQAFSSETGNASIFLITTDQVTWSPDPADITAETPRDGWIVYQGRVV